MHPASASQEEKIMTALQPTIDNAAAANVSADRAQTKPAPQAAPAVSA